MGDRSRCLILLALDGGRCLPASALAAEAGITASTASGHLTRLVEGGLVKVTARGRFRYYSLAGPAVANLIETMARLAPTQQITSLRAGNRAAALRRARTCYDHLAGRLAVTLTMGLGRNGWIEGADLDEGAHPARPGGADDGVAAMLTPSGRAALTKLGVAVPPTDAMRCCVDWSEQRPHLAGAHGRALLSRLITLDWVRRSERGRILLVTDGGRISLRDHFGIAVD